LVISAFDRFTRLMPFVNLDWRMVPCGPRSIAAALHDAGFERTRFVFQLWNPNVQPSRVQIDGGPIDMLLVSSLQVHSGPAYRLIEDAWTMGSQRPLIIAGGPKGCYEPFDFFGLGPDGQMGADVVVTGEEPVLLELLTVLADFGGGQGKMLEAFKRARDAGALREIPGLVYAPDGRPDGRELVNTGIQRLMCDLDDLPMPTSGFRVLEPPHRRKTLAPQPISLGKICSGPTMIALLVTRGCKFNCHFCPIPAYNQRSIRRKSPERVIEEFIDCRREMNARYFFGTDDNFFYSRKFAKSMLEAMASAEFNGKALGRQIRFITESTVVDLYKNRDLLPMARHGRAGVHGIWLGVEDLSARLVDKGQGPGMTEAVFAEMLANDIMPVAMVMHHEDQPLHSPGKLVGLIDQVRFLHKAGAVNLQCTIAAPIVGSRWFSEAMAKGHFFESVGGRKIVDAHCDGNHIAASGRSDPWRFQLELLRGYAAFFNPVNLARTLLGRNRLIVRKRIFFQIWGMLALARTAWRLKGHVWRLWRGPIVRMTELPGKFRRPGSPYADLIKAGEETSRASEQPSGQTVPPGVLTGESRRSAEATSPIHS